MEARTHEEASALANELERRSKAKRDYVVPVAKTAALLSPEGPSITWPSVEAAGAFSRMPLSPTAHEQLGERLGIPRAYYQRLISEHPELWVQNIDGWTGRMPGKLWLLRSLDDRIRAVLSNKYRSFDNHDLFFSTFKTAREYGAVLQSASLGEDEFTIRLVHPTVMERVRFGTGHGWTSFRGDGDAGGGSELVPGAIVSNSETGRHKLVIRCYVVDRVCSNGAIMGTDFARVHIGGALEEGLVDVTSDQTRAIKDQLVWSEVADAIRATFDPERFAANVAAVRRAAETVLEDPVRELDAAVAALEMSPTEKDLLLNEMFAPSHGRDPGATVWGVITAISQIAQGCSPERRLELEAGAGAMLERNAVAVRVRAGGR